MTLLKEGNIITLKAGHKVYAEVPEHFLYSNRRGIWKLGRGECILAGELAFLIGDYVVTKITMDGGGKTFDGDFPDGHHVWCESVDRKHHVDFYQTGCFTAMIKEIEAKGQATLRWVAS